MQHNQARSVQLLQIPMLNKQEQTINQSNTLTEAIMQLQ